MTGCRITLVGDGIENPGNALTMVHAAQMFNAGYRFRDTRELAESGELTSALAGPLPAITSDELCALHARIIACDNIPGARDVYGFRAGRDFAVLVGNERRGISRQFRDLATDAVQIPMRSGRLNCLNVAAASAVALYYLSRAQVGPVMRRQDPGSRRPELLLLGAGNHIELGSAIRSATALGWTRAFIEDRDRVWFGVDRVTRSEGRAAARRARNDIRLIPCSVDTRYGFPEVAVITAKRLGVPIHKADLARGPRQLVVIPDESRVETIEETWTRLGRTVQFAHLDFPQSDFVYHYRLVATVALAEISRQVGVRAADVREPRRRPPIYDRALDRFAEAVGEMVSLAELMDY
jgi:hypothetical protein